MAGERFVLFREKGDRSKENYPPFMLAVERVQTVQVQFQDSAAEEVRTVCRITG
jgi:hypothetical protein